MGRVHDMFGMGRRMVAASLWGMCFNKFEIGRFLAADTLWACAQNVWHGPPYGCGRSMGRVLDTPK